MFSAVCKHPDTAAAHPMTTPQAEFRILKVVVVADPSAQYDPEVCLTLTVPDTL